MRIIHLAFVIAALSICCSGIVIRQQHPGSTSRRIKDILLLSPYANIVGKERGPSLDLTHPDDAVHHAKHHHSRPLNFANSDTGSDAIESRHNKTAHICCSPPKGEALAYLSSGNCYYDANNFFAYFNGTGKIAFDAEKEISYIKFHVFEFTPLQPGPPETQTMTAIKDFKNGVWYEIYEDGTCNKDNITRDQIEIMCIPGRANMVSHGKFGGSSVDVSTYEFDTFRGLVMNRLTVERQGTTCQPIMTSFSIIKENPNAVYNLDVVDMTTTISDPSIFTPPPSCNK